MGPKSWVSRLMVPNNEQCGSLQPLGVRILQPLRWFLLHFSDCGISQWMELISGSAFCCLGTLSSLSFSLLLSAFVVFISLGHLYPSSIQQLPGHLCVASAAAAVPSLRHHLCLL